MKLDPRLDSNCQENTELVVVRHLRSSYLLGILIHDLEGLVLWQNLLGNKIHLDTYQLVLSNRDLRNRIQLYNLSSQMTVSDRLMMKKFQWGMELLWF